uniref:Uncharacterized protein n=1 Tax=Arundo donax TaxID=35708 RepID=A0A0A9DX37_ARUDO
MTKITAYYGRSFSWMIRVWSPSGAITLLLNPQGRVYAAQ